MTTITCNRKMMAADTQMDSNGTISQGRKIFEVNGDLIGFAGLVSEGLKFVQWYATQDEEDEISLEDTIAVVLTSKGLILAYETNIPMEVLGDHYAIGSGEQGALVAMDQGHNPIEAIKIVSRRDAYTGSEVFYKELE